MHPLEQNRKEIDRIDAEMAKLFERRMEASREIAAYKKEHALPVSDPEREAKVLEAGCSRISDPLLREYYATFLRDTMKASRAYQSRLCEGIRVVYSGEAGAFASAAAQKAFPEVSPFAGGDFAAVYRSVEDGTYDCAVLPLENSYAGEVGAVMDLIFSGSLYVNRIIELAVEHCLLSVPGATTDTIKTVVSHPQALEQCAEFLSRHGMREIPYSNTALAAGYVAEQKDPTVAAIASRECADRFGLEILESGIQTARTNTTRFAVLSRAQQLPPAGESGNGNRFLLVFSTRNEAGALAQTLDIIGAHHYNLWSLRSRPMKELIWSYYFFVEAEGNINTRNGQEMLRELSALCDRLKLAGAYKGEEE